jgi:hypothetical protein
VRAALLALACLFLACDTTYYAIGSSGDRFCTCAHESCDDMEGIITGCVDTGQSCPSAWGDSGVWVCGDRIPRGSGPRCDFGPVGEEICGCEDEWIEQDRDACEDVFEQFDTVESCRGNVCVGEHPRPCDTTLYCLTMEDG